jgi:response regulator RpfG family c-di-GMP phosphodiesterase
MNQSDQKKTILLVDDAPANIQVANAILKDTYKIRIATNGAKALELANATPTYRSSFLLDRRKLKTKQEASKSAQWITSTSLFLPQSSWHASKRT